MRALSSVQGSAEPGGPEAPAKEALRAGGGIPTDATTFRLDGSDLMPGGVGPSAFRSAVVGHAAAEGADGATAEARARRDTLP